MVRPISCVVGLAALAGCGARPVPFPQVADGCCPTCLCEAPLPVARPAQLAFAAVPVGQSEALKLTIADDGAQPLHVTGVSIDLPDFALDGTLPAVLQPGASATLGIRFTPGAAGTESATASFQTDSPQTPVLHVPLSGEGVDTGWICVQPAAIDFGPVPVGASATLRLEVQACGSSAAGFASLGITPPGNGFSTSGPPFGPIPPGQSESWDVIFSPTATVGAIATLAYTLCPTCGPSMGIPVSGTGTPGLEFSPDAVDFGTVPVGQRVSMAVTATNVEPVAVTVQTLAPYARGEPSFSLLTVPALPATLAPGASLTFTVEDAPTQATTGKVKGEFDATYTVGASPTQYEAGVSAVGGAS